MSKFFKPKDYLKNDGDKVKVQIVTKHETKEGKFGTYVELDVIVNGKALRWDADQKYLEKIKNAGCKTTFWILAYKTSYGSVGYNFAPLGDVTASTGKEVTEAKDDFQDKVNMGASFNAGQSYMIYRACGGKLGVLEWLDEVKKNGAIIAPHQKAFVNGEQKSTVDYGAQLYHPETSASQMAYDQGEATQSPVTPATQKDEEPPAPTEPPPETKSYNEYKADLDDSLPF